MRKGLYIGLASFGVILGCHQGADSTQPPENTKNSCMVAGSSSEMEIIEPQNENPQLNKKIAEIATLHKMIREIKSSLPPTEAEPLIVSIIKARSTLLNDIIQMNPAAIPGLLWSKTEKPSLPFEANGCLEREIELEGMLEIYAALRQDGSEALVSYLSTSAGKKYALHFENGSPEFRTGDQIKIKGIHFPCSRENETQYEPVVLRRESVQLTELASAPSTTSLGQQNLGIILLKFQDSTSTPDTGEAEEVIFNEVNNFLLENSFQQTSVTGRILGPYTIPLSKIGCNFDSIANAAHKAANDAGVDLSQFNRYLYVFPRNSCNWYGLGTVGGNPSKAWINDSLVLHTVAHELGHNLGLFHSNSLACGSSPIGRSCSKLEYGDTADTMGNLSPGHYNAYQKERLGWLSLPQLPSIRTVNESGVYTIEPFETLTSGEKAIKVLKSISVSGARVYYYVEFRQNIGFDTILHPYLTSSVLVHTGNDRDGNTSYLLNMNPTTGSWYRAGLSVGQEFQDSSAGLSIKVISIQNSGASLQINLNGTPAPQCP